MWETLTDRPGKSAEEAEAADAEEMTETARRGRRVVIIEARVEEAEARRRRMPPLVLPPAMIERICFVVFFRARCCFSLPAALAREARETGRSIEGAEERESATREEKTERGARA